jgi:hypothetical protein
MTESRDRGLRRVRGVEVVQFIVGLVHNAHSRVHDVYRMPGRNVQVHYVHSDILTQSEHPL